tara:strand:+ start:1903 stop:2547 length:645 start_codon:yes stop_codon:yes gene_type:complete
MTSSSVVRGWFSPERILLVLPIVLGVGIGTLLVMAGVVPIVVQLQDLREEIEVMELKQLGLPALQARLRALERELRQKQEQQARLVAVVAGPNQLKTFLATVNDLTVESGIQIGAVESKPVVRYVAPPQLQPNATQSAVATPPAPPSDPFLRPGMERRSVVISLKGTFQALLVFLRELEALEVITITDELTLLNTGQAEELTQLTLSVSAYGRS